MINAGIGSLVYGRSESFRGICLQSRGYGCLFKLQVDELNDIGMNEAIESNYEEYRP